MQQICILMTRSPNKARMEENPVNLQDHVTAEEITGSVNALTRRKGRVTPKRNRKSPSRNSWLLLLQAFQCTGHAKDTHILADMELEMPNGWTQTTALIDYGMDHCYFSYKFLLSKGFCPVSKQLLPSTFIDGTKTHCFTCQKFNINIFNHQGVSQSFELGADAINMQEYDMLISRDWLYQVNPDIQWNTTCWHYWNASSTKIKIHHATHFFKIACG